MSENLTEIGVFIRGEQLQLGNLEMRLLSRKRERERERERGLYMEK
jgi:hypothetical protein